MTDLLHDLRHAVRTLRASPGFTFASIATLALAIGANATIFSGVYATLLEAPPYRAPQELALVTPVLDFGPRAPETQQSWSYPMYEVFKEAAGDDLKLAAFTPRPQRVNLAGADAAEPVQVEMVSQPYFGILEVAPRLGRFFTPDEDRTPTAHPVVVLSEGLWRRLFGADPAIVGRTIHLNAAPFTVVGVAPAGFRGLSDQADLWIPMMMAPTLTFPRRLAGEYSFWHMVVGRIPAGTDPAKHLMNGARAIEERLQITRTFEAAGLRLTVVPLQAARADRRLGRALLVLLGAVVLVLLIACANIAGLHLARARRRRRELGIRVALGAGRARLTRELFVESAVLAASGGLLGVLLSAWGLDLLNALRPQALAMVGGPGGARLSLPVLAFAAVATMGAALLFGLLPAFSASRTDPLALLRADSPTADRLRMRGALVATEIAMAVVLVASAGLLIRTVVALSRTPLGFDPRQVVVAFVNPPSRAYDSDSGRRLYREAAERVAALPGVLSAGVGNCLPVAGGCDQVRMTIAGKSAPAGPGDEVWLNMVDERYLAALGIPVVAGRGILGSDRLGAPEIALVSETAARRYWPGKSPVGERIRLTVGWPERDGWAEVVGVVRDVKFDGNLRTAAAPGVYLSMAQFSYLANYIVAKVEGDPGAATAAIASVVRGLDPQLSLWDPGAMTRHVEKAAASERFSMVLLGAFGLLALALAAVGIYGVIAYSVAGRTRELGIRVALGARPGGVLGLVFRQGFGFVAPGMIAGALAALAATRVLGTQLYEVAPSDPATLLTALGVIGVVAAVAIWLPARRATRIAPLEALRLD